MSKYEYLFNLFDAMSIIKNIDVTINIILSAVSHNAGFK